MNDRGRTGPSDERISRLSAAILRISQSLDLATVLEEVVEGARALTGARSGVITTIEERGQVQDFVTSGLPPEERRMMLEWPDGPRLFEHLRDLATPLRVADLPGYLGSLGLSSNPWGAKTLQGTPMHHGGEHLGHFFLADKEDGEAFTAEDEEILVLFASQAATAIANARTHLDVERARASLEALVETSPVGVVVFDARTGRPVSFNREAQRIVEEIRTPGHPTEQLLEVMTFRHADGPEISLEEFPLARQLEDATTMRAEEIELSVPDGRSVRTLINVTPIHSEEGELVSVVVTMQDLEPLEELERQRSEFLGMVSHELRAPLTSIKGSTATVLGAAPPPPQAEMLQFFRIIDGQADHMRGLIANLLDAGSIEAGTLTVAPEPSSVAVLVDRARNTFLSGGGRHPVLVDLPPDLPRAMADPERIVQVLEQPPRRTRHGKLPRRRRSASRRSPKAATSRSRSRTRAGASRPTGSRISSGSAPAPPEAPGSGSRSRRASSRHTAAVSGPRAEGRARARASPSRSRRPETPPRRPRPAAGRARPGGGGRRRASSWWTTTRRRCATYGKSSPMRATRRSCTGDPDGLAGLIRAEKPRLVLLDLMLPGTDGIELMKQVPQLADLPVIFISGYGRDETIARAFESGAADYIVKPFSPTELVARVQAALRSRAEPEAFVHGELAVDYGLRRVSVAGREVALTATEFDLLRTLSVNAGRVMTTEVLLRQVWGRRGSDDTDRVRTVVKKLRAKLGDNAANPNYIFTEHGVGYRMVTPGEA